MIPALKRNAYICPKCSRVSRNPSDIEHNYCGHCFEFTDQGLLPVLRIYQERLSKSLTEFCVSNFWSPAFYAETVVNAITLFSIPFINHLADLGDKLPHKLFQEFLATPSKWPENHYDTGTLQPILDFLKKRHAEVRALN